VDKEIKIAVVGATGYTGQELVRLLAGHPQAKIEGLISQTYAGRKYSEVFPSFTGSCDQILLKELETGMLQNCDVVFFALPHGMAASRVDEQFLGQTKVIDLSADFRLSDAGQYDIWYQSSHPRPDILSKAIYGLPEWRREQIKTATLVANPGCYATCAMLSLLPLSRENLIEHPVIVDAKSGVSGAGRSPSIDTHFNEVNESIKAYKVAVHRHTPEIEQELSAVSKKPVKVVFTPHLVPMNRGILVTAYCSIRNSISQNDLFDIYESKYGSEPFVKVLRQAMPETRWTRGSNQCHIGLKMDKRTGHVIVVGAIDNLIKGAAGQAVQNLNLMFGLPETMGLTQMAVLP
jgi:N-acetyl-gamma-glutamyl-phosphate reductase